MIMGRVLLECLHDSQEAQLLFCENQDNEAGMNFTPCANSLIVLNVVMQNQRIFKDVRSFNAFKKHCNALKADLEAAPKPADPRLSNDTSPEQRVNQPPKCWIYSFSDDQMVSREELAQFKLNDLE